MKKITAILLTAMLLVAMLTSCGEKVDIGGLGKDSQSVSQPNNNQTSTGQGDGTGNGNNPVSTGLELETYNGGDFTLKIPKGWQLSSGGEGMYFWYSVTNPYDDSMRFFRYGKLEPILKSEAARQSWKKWGPITGDGVSGVQFGYAPVCTEKTAKSVLEAWGEFIDFQKYIGQSNDSLFVPLSNISVKSCDSYQGMLSSLGVPETIAVASCQTASGKNAEISVTASVMDPGYQDLFMEGIDTYYMTIYELNGILLPQGCDKEIAKSLLQCVSSLEFSEDFLRKAQQQSDATLSSVLQRSAENEALMDAYMRKWGY